MHADLAKYDALDAFDRCSCGVLEGLEGEGKILGVGSQLTAHLVGHGGERDDVVDLGLSHGRRLSGLRAAATATPIATAATAALSTAKPGYTSRAFHGRDEGLWWC